MDTQGHHRRQPSSPIDRPFEQITQALGELREMMHAFEARLDRMEHSQRGAATSIPSGPGSVDAAAHPTPEVSAPQQRTVPSQPLQHAPTPQPQPEPQPQPQPQTQPQPQRDRMPEPSPTLTTVPTPGTPPLPEPPRTAPPPPPSPLGAPMPAGPRMPPSAYAAYPAPAQVTTGPSLGERISSRLTTATVLASLGGAVLLIGVGFLLIMAARSGYFGPVPRVAGAAVLAVGLIGGGIVLQRRNQRATTAVEPGALALVGTGFATAILDVIAATSLYHWLPVLVGYVLVGALAVAGLWLGRLWTSSLLSGLVGCGVMLLAPLLSLDMTLLVFVTIVGVTMIVIGTHHAPWLRAVRTAVPAVYLAGFFVTGELEGIGEHVIALVAATVFAAAVVASTCADVNQENRYQNSAAFLNIPAAVPLLAIGSTGFVSPMWWLYAIFAATYLALALVIGQTMRQRPQGESLTAVIGVLGSSFLAVMIASFGDGSAVTLGALTAAAAYLAVGATMQRTWVDVVGGCAAAVALCLYVVIGMPFLVLIESVAVLRYGIEAVAHHALALVLSIVAFRWVARRVAAENRKLGQICAAICGLGSSAAMIVAVGVVIGRAFGEAGASNGFFGAHLLLTVAWVVVAALLVLSDSGPIPRPRRAGFVLGGLALVKLFVIDLAMLPGVLRVIAFLVVGAVLLAVAIRFRDEEDLDPTASAPAGGAPGHGTAPVPPHEAVAGVSPPFRQGTPEAHTGQARPTPPPPGGWNGGN